MMQFAKKHNMNNELISFKKYSLLTNDTKSRAGIYIRNQIKFIQRSELEGLNNGLVIADLNLRRKYRLINVFRMFNPPDGRT